MGRVVEQQLGKALVAAVGDGAPGCCPRKLSPLHLDPFSLRLVFGEPDPGDLGIGVCDRRNHARVEERFLASGRFGRHVALVHRLVREHRLTDDVADGVDVRHVGAHLRVGRNETAVADGHTGLVRADVPAVRAAAHREQHHVVGLRSRGRLLALEADVDRVLLRFGADGLGLQHHAIEARLVHSLPDFDQVAVRTEHQTVEHFDHVEPRT